MTTESSTKWPDYLTLWRWHFYAGLFCIPIVLILSVTGTIYLFKPQIQAYHESSYTSMSFPGQALPISQQIKVAVESTPGSVLDGYIVPSQDAGAANSVTKLSLQVHGRNATAYVNPTTGVVVGTIYEDDSIVQTAKKLHGELMLGKRGSYLVELTACWTLVMVLTGLALWWPRTGWRLAGVVYPRFNAKRRMFWKDMHSVVGFWVSGLVVVLIVTGLPWATFWGDYFKAVRGWTGTSVVKQDWESGHQSNKEHAGHEGAVQTQKSKPKGGGFRRQAPPKMDSYALAEIDIVATAAGKESLQSPVVVRPPRDKSSTWTIQSETANRPYRTTIAYNAKTGSVESRGTFEEKHWIDQAVGQGIAIHEGARFGWFNQLLALLATSGLVFLSLSSVVMWRMRKQPGLGAPQRKSPKDYEVSWARKIGLRVCLGLMAVLMPLFGLSVVVVWLFDFVVLQSFPRKPVTS